MKRIYRFAILGILLITIIGLSQIWQVRDYTFQLMYDLQEENLVVDNKITIDEILKRFSLKSKKALSKTFIDKTDSNQSKYQKMLKGAKYFQVPQREIYRKVAGNTRIKDLMSRDEFYKKALFNRSESINWLIDKQILYKIIELRAELKKNDYNENGFQITYGHRNPKHNKEINGASKSKHIKGEAVDMTIKDINNDGKYTAIDKEIIIFLLEEKIIKNKGGIGKYPGTRTVHMDVRGYRARWDSY